MAARRRAIEANDYDERSGEVSMFRKAMIAALLAVLGAACSADRETMTSTSPAPAAEPSMLDASAVLADVAEAMGAQGLESITLSGSAWNVRNGFRQTPNASPPWPYRDYITSYVRTIDLGAPASLATGDTYAQNIFLDPAVPGTYTQNVTAGQTAWSEQLEIWLTPWGFVRGAQTNGAVADRRSVGGREYTVLSWMSPESKTAPSGLRYLVRGYVDDDNLIERVETWVEDPFMGDMLVAEVYDDYRDMNGLMVPRLMEQQRGGGGIFGVIVTRAVAKPSNLAALMTPPPRSGGGGFPGGGGQVPDDLVEPLADHVWLINGGYVSLVAEFSDHLMVIEAGQSEARGRQIIDEVRRALPAKPIRYVVNSHPHSDHTAGLVPLIRAGARLVTHANNVEFLSMALGAPRTLLGEQRMSPQVEGVDGVAVYEDEMMRVELHHVPNRHSDGMLVAVLPDQGILFQADFTLPQQGAEANPFVKELARYVDEHDVQFERYLAVHAAQVPQTRADLMAALDD
jgi:glyoxylase-like metal-dependent hydrolase (beta-lactamase superfamily II)